MRTLLYSTSVISSQSMRKYKVSYTRQLSRVYMSSAVLCIASLSQLYIVSHLEHVIAREKFFLFSKECSLATLLQSMLFAM